LTGEGFQGELEGVEFGHRVQTLSCIISELHYSNCHSAGKKRRLFNIQADFVGSRSGSWSVSAGELFSKTPSNCHQRYKPRVTVSASSQKWGHSYDGHCLCWKLMVDLDLKLSFHSMLTVPAFDLRRSCVSTLGKCFNVSVFPYLCF
jgi:hypothetical protein